MPIGGRTHEEREGHLATMEEALLDGRSVREVVAAAVAKFGVSKSTAYEDVATIRGRWVADGQRDREAEFAKAVNRRERLIARALRVAAKAEQTDALPTVLSAIGTAASLERDKSKLLNLYPERTVNVRPVGPRSVTDMTEGELLAFIGGGDDITDEELAAIAGHEPQPAPGVGPHPAAHAFGEHQ